ncbi:MAG TPA: HEAT repeat domain-containing protein [Pirellulales bacterium]|nr:HEAT repeat domain-containing protein [Pirellulales bacterium]
MSHPDSEVRKRAAHDFVFLIPEEETVRALATALADPIEGVRREAGVNLFCSGESARHAVPELIAALDHPDVFIRRTAAAALSNVGPEARSALTKLNELRDTTDSLFRAWVAEAIRRLS